MFLKSGLRLVCWTILLNVMSKISALNIWMAKKSTTLAKFAIKKADLAYKDLYKVSPKSLTDKFDIIETKHDYKK